MKLWHKVIIGLVAGIAFGIAMQDNPREIYEGNGNTYGYDFNFAIEKPEDVKVIYTPKGGQSVRLKLDESYSLDQLEKESAESKNFKSGKVTLFRNLAAGDIIEISRGVPSNKAKILTDYVKPIGTLFINAIKMVVIPLIFFALIAGITSMTDSESFKRVGLKSVVAYMMTCLFAVCIGLAFGTIFKPGEGLDPAALESLSTGTKAPAPEKGKEPTVMGILLDVIPTNPIKSMAEDHILQVVVFAIFIGMMLNVLGDKVRLLIDVMQQAAQLTFKMIETVIKFSPYGVFALIAVVVGTQGTDILVALFKFGVVVAAAMLVQYFLFIFMIIIFGRMSPWPFCKKVLETQSIAFSTSSSKATLSTAMRVAHERLGVSKSNTSFVLPLGASINMDGTAIYLGICALFFAQLYHVPLDTHHYYLIILTSTLASIGAAGIPGGSLIMMSMVLTTVGLPLEGIALIAGIDRILDMLRTTVNITGDTLITMLVDKSEGTMDQNKYYDMSL